MTPAFRAAVLAALLPLAAVAQEAAETPTDEAPAPAVDADADAAEAPAETAPAGPARVPGGELSTGTAAAPAGQAAAPAQPGIYVREEHGDFEVRCLQAPDGQEDPCQLFQRLSDAEGNPTADINFFDLPPGSELAGGATILTPLQTLLTAQVTISIDGGQPRRYPFAFCDQSGCYARLGFTEADLNQFRRGASARVVVVPALAPDQPAELTLSLSGITAGLAAIEVEG